MIPMVSGLERRTLNFCCRIEARRDDNRASSCFSFSSSPAEDGAVSLFTSLRAEWRGDGAMLLLLLFVVAFTLSGGKNGVTEIKIRDKRKTRTLLWRWWIMCSIRFNSL